MCCFVALLLLLSPFAAAQSESQGERKRILFLRDTTVTGLPVLDLELETGNTEFSAAAERFYTLRAQGNPAFREYGSAALAPVFGKERKWSIVKFFAPEPGRYVLVVLYHTKEEGGILALDDWNRDEDGKWLVRPLIY